MLNTVANKDEQCTYQLAGRRTKKSAEIRYANERLSLNRNRAA